MTLSQYATDRKTGKLKRGAMSRIAEFLGISKPTVKRYLTGEWTPCDGTKRRIQDLVASRLPLASKKPGPRVTVQVIEETHVTRKVKRNTRNQLNNCLPTKRK